MYTTVPPIRAPDNLDFWTVFQTEFENVVFLLVFGLFLTGLAFCLAVIYINLLYPPKEGKNRRY